MKVLRVFGNYNPSGIEIYPGYYALAGCILTDMTVEEAIAKIIYGKDVSPELKPRKKRSKVSDICAAYRGGVTDYGELARRFSVDKRYVWQSLIDKGVVKHNDFPDKLDALMEREPNLSQKQIAGRLGCGLSTVSRLLRLWYKKRGIGYF